jgi:hypothetical protein
MDLLKIYEGWSKGLGLQKVSEENKKLSLDRLKICVGAEGLPRCEYAKEMWLKKIINGILRRNKQNSGIGCIKCGCPVNEKSLVIHEKCPVGKW